MGPDRYRDSRGPAPDPPPRPSPTRGEGARLKPSPLVGEGWVGGASRGLSRVLLVLGLLGAGPNSNQDDYARFALSGHGDAARGSVVFSDPKGVGCIRCHRVDGGGGDLGPDLSDIG